MSEENNLKIRLAEPKDQQELNDLIAKFRQSLARLRKQENWIDFETAQAELAEYQQKKFPIYIAETGQGRIVKEKKGQTTKINLSPPDEIIDREGHTSSKIDRIMRLG